jgi:hypothetical protein
MISLWVPKNSSGSLPCGFARAARMVCWITGAAIHPNRPVADTLGTSRDQGGWTWGSNCSGYSP